MELENEVFQQFKPKLITAIGDSVLIIANECQARGLINGTHEKIVYKEEIPTKQATLLVDAVEKCITTDIDNFEVFLGILDDRLLPTCKKPLSEMREKLKSLRDRRIFRFCTDDKMASDNSVVDVPKSSYSPFKATVSKQKRQKDVTKSGEPNCGKNLPYSVSNDSGISIGRSDSIASEHDDSLLKLNNTQSEDPAPIEETPLNNDNQPNGVTSATFPPILSSKMSDRLLSVEQDVKNLQQDIINLQSEAKQKEAAEIWQKMETEQLQEKLKRMVKEKKEIEEKLRIKQRKVTELTNARKCEKRKLEDMTEVVDGLKTQIANGEASRDKLVKQVRDCNRKLRKQTSEYEHNILLYELEVETLKARIEDKERAIRELKSKLEGNALLQQSNLYELGEEYKTEWRSESGVQRSNSHELREEIQEKLQVTEEKLCQCEKQLSKEQSCQCIYMVFIGLLVIVIAMVLHMYII